MKLQLTIAALELILNEAKYQSASDKDMSTTVEIELVSSKDTHLGNDNIKAYLKSNYAECYSLLLV